MLFLCQHCSCANDVFYANILCQHLVPTLLFCFVDVDFVLMVFSYLCCFCVNIVIVPWLLFCWCCSCVDIVVLLMVFLCLWCSPANVVLVSTLFLCRHLVPMLLFADVVFVLIVFLYLCCFCVNIVDVHSVWCERNYIIIKTTTWLIKQNFHFKSAPLFYAIAFQANANIAHR